MSSVFLVFETDNPFGCDYFKSAHKTREGAEKAIEGYLESNDKFFIEESVLLD